MRGGVGGGVSILLLAFLLLTTGVGQAASTNYGTTPPLSIPALGDGGWGSSINQSLKDLTDFNANYANPDGTLKAGVTATQWAQAPTAYYISASSINVQGDQTSLFEVGRKVWVNQAIDVIGTVSTAVYANGWTAVTLSPIVLYSDNTTASSITNDITSISVGLNTPRSDPGAPQNVNAGYMKLGWFYHSGATQTTFLAGTVEVNDGSTSRLVYWDSAIVFDYGPGGSSAGSGALAAKQWFYIYIYTATLSPTGGTITAANIFNSSAAPSYYADRHGWYNSTNRCIAAFRTNGTSTLEPMLDMGDGWIGVAGWQAGNGFDNFLAVGGATTYTALYPDVPTGTNQILVNYQHSVAGGIYVSMDGGNDALYLGISANDAGEFVFPLSPTTRALFYRVGASGQYINFFTTGYHTSY